MRKVSDRSFRVSSFFKASIPLCDWICVIGSPVKGGPKRGCDQFGLAGLMSSLKAIETDPGLVVLPIGYEVSPLLGFNLLTTPQDEKISSSFSGPFGSGRLPAHLIEADVPAEYKISETSAQDEEFIKPIR